MQFASALVSDQIPGVAIDADALTPFRGAMRAASELFGASTETLQLIEKQLSANAPPTTLTALLLGSPDFQRK
jgi:hypothetical protein